MHKIHLFHGLTPAFIGFAERQSDVRLGAMMNPNMRRTGWRQDSAARQAIEK